MSLLVTQARDNLAVITKAGALFGFTLRFAQTSLRIPRSNAGLPKEEPTTAVKNDCLEDIDGGKENRKGKKLEKWDLRTSNVLVKEVLFAEEAAVKYFC